ncbi:MAG TPA: ribosome biogenesis GTP-binding protein YihA/YsxC [Coxiellaceae bacterium]|nr:ribosome biogenesis GTP-binding protein YihA/YsxC [Coxiellaceae bacterium]
MVKTIDYQKAEYVLSAVALEQLPPDIGAEVAFIGYSNAGKSSALNTLTGNKGLARVSNTPGRTQAINIFSLGSKYRLVDLPGYGYAKVPRPVRERWHANIEEYLQKRGSLRGLVLVMDIRHPLKELDYQLIEWTIECHIPLHILLTKADKLSRMQALKTLREIQAHVEKMGGEITLQLFSSLERVGVDEFQAQLKHWLLTLPEKKSHLIS